jgi:hypothetical protein
MTNHCNKRLQRKARPAGQRPKINKKGSVNAEPFCNKSDCAPYDQLKTTIPID